MNELEIFPGIKTLNGYRAIFIEKLNAIVISDLQLGEELYLAEEQGVFLPQTQLKEIKKDLEAILKLTKAKKLIVNGDFKHEFGEASEQEWREVKELTEFVKQKVEEIILVRGNHDNYLLTIASHIGLQVFDPYYFVDGTVFTHGHKNFDFPKNTKTIIIGHEQPALLLRKGFDRIKVPCLLYGKDLKNRNFICLPAFSPLSSGVSVNAISKEELLSPILREDVNLEELNVIALDKEVGALKFPKIKDLLLEV